jgi:hypothetical protein
MPTLKFHETTRTEMMLTPQSSFMEKICGAGSGVTMNSISVSGALTPSDFVDMVIVQKEDSLDSLG